jgi:multidrug efflux pump subunit AcrB
MDSKAAHRKGAIAWMASNSVAANLLMLVFLIGGLFFAGQVKQEVFPEFDTDIIRVSIPYPGASPEEVEQGVVLPIEDRVRGLDGVKRVTSFASENAGTIIIELLNNANPSKALQDAKNEVDGISFFPQDAEKPIISLVESRKQVVNLLVHGDQPMSVLRHFAEKVQDDLIQTPGITLVELGIAPKPEIAIEIPKATLRSLDLTLNEIASSIRQRALEVPGGEVKAASGSILLRTNERREFASEFGNLPVAIREDGSRITLADIAVVKETFRDDDTGAWFNTSPAIQVKVFRIGEQTPQSVSTAVNAYIEKTANDLPDGTKLTIWRDTSTIYKDRMNLLLKNASLGLVLVVILLGLFLEPRLAFWVMLGILISVIGSFIFIPFTGASINMISLFAFIITLGIIVDDAIVVGENIYEKREQGHSTLDAAILGAQQISKPVFFAILTNIVAFMPLFFVPGISGKFFMQIPAIVVSVFLISLIESLYILPAHLAHVSARSHWSRRLDSVSEVASQKLDYLVTEVFAKKIPSMLRHRYFTLSIAIASLIVCVGIILGGHIRFSFIPRVDSDLITADIKLPVGTTYRVSDQIKQKVVKAAELALIETGEENIAKGIYSQIGGGLAGFGPGPSRDGGSGSHVVAVQVSLVSSGERDIGGVAFSRLWRSEVEKIEGIQTMSFRAETGASEGAALEYNLSHRDRKVLEKAAAEFRRRMETYAGVKDSDDGVNSGKRQFGFTITPKAEAMGLTPVEIGRQIRAAFYGAEALRQQRGRSEVKVLVRLPEIERRQAATVENFTLRLPNGGEIPLLEAVNREDGNSYTQITRKDGRRILTVTADVDDRKGNATQIGSSLFENDVPELLKQFPGLSFSLGGEREAQRDSIKALGNGFILCLIVMYALLAIPFSSYFQPLIVMLSIPFGIIGAVIGHFLLGYGLSIVSLFGIIALAGVVVNDSLVLVVTANENRDNGMSAYDAICNASIRRFRPIVLTSITTFFGLAPMIFETSVQARFLIPMAISLGFGVLFATVIILIVIPAAYLALEDITLLFSRYIGGSEQKTSESMR